MGQYFDNERLSMILSTLNDEHLAKLAAAADRKNWFHFLPESEISHKMIETAENILLALQALHEGNAKINALLAGMDENDPNLQKLLIAAMESVLRSHEIATNARNLDKSASLFYTQDEIDAAKDAYIAHALSIVNS